MISQIDEIDPENRFSERSKIERSVGRRGSGPSKRLLEKSITLSVGGKSANHVGMVSEILALEISRLEMFL